MDAIIRGEGDGDGCGGVDGGLVRGHGGVVEWPIVLNGHAADLRDGARVVGLGVPGGRVLAAPTRDAEPRAGPGVGDFGRADFADLSVGPDGALAAIGGADWEEPGNHEEAPAIIRGGGLDV